MVRFDGKLRLASDPSSAIKAVLVVDDARLKITAGDHEIGNWHLRDLTISHRPEGVALAVEGDELIVAVSDRSGLAEALVPPPERTPKKRPARLLRRKKPSEPEALSTVDALPAIGTPQATQRITSSAPESAPPVVSHLPKPQPQTAAPAEHDRAGIGERIAAMPLEMKAAAAVLVVVALMFVFVPRLLALILGLSGAAGLLIGAAAEDPYFGVRMPSWIRSRPTMIAGGILLALALFVFWIR